jgi:phospholipid/cholesterol/gamma-HCH transport system substrate-binding protein
MERRAKVITVALFLLLSVLALWFFTRWISDEEITSQRYPILFRGAVSGLSVGSEVRYLGVPIGQVVDINAHLQRPGFVQVAITSNAMPPRQSLVAVLQGQGITGLSLIELVQRSPERPGFATAEGEMPGYPSLFNELSEDATVLTQTAIAALERTNNLMSNENIAHFSNTLENVDKVSANLASATDNMGELVSRLTRVSQELERATPEFRSLISRIDKEMVPAVTAAGDAGEKLIDDNRHSINRLVGQYLPALLGLTDQLSNTLQNIGRLSSKIEQDPSSLLYGEKLNEAEINLD